MRFHGLYYIPNQGAQLAASQDMAKQIVSGIEARFPRADAAGAWTLNHRILRDVPPYSENPQAAYDHAYQHLLHVSTLSPDRTYNLIQHKASSAMTSIPLSQTDAHFSFLANQMPLLWAPQRVLDVPNGKIYQAGDFVIGVGELRSRRQASAGTHTSPGLIICISTHAGGPDSEAEGSSSPTEDGDVDFEYAQESIRELWSAITKDVTFNRSDARPFMQPTQDSRLEPREQVVRMWCVALSPKA
ncbi:hypothetical protein BU23DRAFT_570431 [Bimuria novae-zelandiae CBS 107.79]|uniref:Mediator of RNA polymerase II transcription subunit 20 n=1 Tax=Bimuria novae-zelandiae CBS 107.79 TaxID=1447943 RepID=A0A6A5V3W4_9PLEO|nr:hypothetical protein BU23DRAFT_570431 [Bimuria novae-zelandiae CBS 107.79]